MTIANLGIRAAYALNLRTWANKRQRELTGEVDAERTPLPSFDAPAALEEYALSRFEYRKDSGKLGGLVYPLDWITEPEVFHARLLDGEVDDGDCDDFHAFVAACLELIPSVREVYLLSSGFRRRKGHTSCVYRQGEQWYLFDYEIEPIDDPNDAPRRVALTYSKPTSDHVPWYVFETTDHEPVAIGPRGRIPGT